MSEKKQVGLRVDADLYRQFKQDVKDRRGRWQGVAGEELENALAEYLSGVNLPAPEDADSDIERRLARIEQAVGVSVSDGGPPRVETTEHTHAPTERPPPETTTEKKVRWLATVVEDRVVKGEMDSFEEVPRSTLKDVVADEYGFRRDTAKRYVEDLIDHFNLVPHPDNDALLLTEERRKQLIRENAKDREEEIDA